MRLNDFKILEKCDKNIIMVDLDNGLAKGYCKAKDFRKKGDEE